MRTFTFVLSIIFYLIFSTAVINAQQQEPLAEQLASMLKSDVFNVGILVQSEAVFSFEDDQFNGGRAFDLGATRMDFNGNLDSGFSYRLQLDFRRQTSVLDAQVSYRFSEGFRLTGGAFKASLSRDLDPSPGDTDFLNRARQVGAMMNSREIGVTTMGQSGGLNYRFGVYNGTGLSRQNDNRFMYAARLGYTFEMNNASLMLGFNGALNQTRSEVVGNTGLISQKDRVLLGGFVDYDSDVLFGTFELLTTRFDAENLGGASETILGFYGTLGAKIDERNEILARWDHLEFDISRGASELFTIGWNRQLTSLFSFAVNGLALIPDSGDNQFGVSGVFQFQF